MTPQSIGILNLEAGLTPEEIMMDSVEVEIAPESPLDDLGEGPELLTFDMDTGEIVSETEDEDDKTGVEFEANLAEHMEEDTLDKLGQQVLDYVEQDLRSRQPWFDRYANGLKSLGIYDPAASNEVLGTAEIIHPMLLEAGTQFQARAMSELFPPNGPVKGSPIGDPTQDKMEQAARVEGYMNYQLTIEDRGYYDEQDQKYFRLPFSGSEFDKQYYCPVKKRNVSKWVRCENFIAPYGASSLADAPHYTELIPTTHNNYRRMVKVGFYLEVELDEADNAEVPEGIKKIEETIAVLQGEDKPAVTDADNADHIFYECHMEYDLPGFEEDIALPYIVTVDKETGKVLSIYRNWKEHDDTQQKRVWYTHKKFLPGFGFYGFGFIHAIGGLGEAATKILNILIDSGAFSTLQGGFKSKDAKIRGDIVLQPGVWADTEMTADELSKAFYTPNFKEPSQTLHTVLGALVAGGERFAATTEVMVGDAATTGPVGTTVAMIEQGSKVFSGIHKRLHKAIGDELIHLAELNGENLPDAYPYETKDGQMSALRADFDSRVDVTPVSDPNIFSSAQRIAMAQTALQLAQSMPDIAERRTAAISLLEAMRFPNAEKIFPKPQEAERAEPVAEGAMVVIGRPVRAFIDQDHQSHLMVHNAQLQGLPEPAKPGMQAHMMEHMAMATRMQFQQMLGQPLPPINWGAEKNQPMMPQLPPEVENQIAMMAAQAVQKMMQEQQAKQQAEEAQKQGAPAQPPEDPRIAAQQKEQEFMHAQQLKDAGHQAEQKRKDTAAMEDADRKDALAGISPALVKQASEFIAKTGVGMSPRELAMLAKVTGKDFQTIVAELSRMLMAGQGGSQSPIADQAAGVAPGMM